MNIDPDKLYKKIINAHMFWLCIVLFSLGLLSGCATRQISTPVEVKIPVPVICQEQIPDAPEKMTCFKNTDDDIQDLIDNSLCLLAERKEHLSYETLLLQSLKACTNK